MLQNHNMKNISSFIVMDILDKANEMEKSGNNIIHLEIGEPDFPTPPAVINAGIEALQKGDTHYTHSMGKIELREAIAAYYKKTYQVKISPEQIIVTSGTSPAMLLVFSSLFNKSDEIILSDPYYACYPNFINHCDCTAKLVPTHEKNAFKYTIPDLEKALTPKTKAILINSPANPTGSILSEQELSAIAALKPLIISDEIYHGLNYQGKDHCILEYTDNAIVINGFSKLFAMTGWRLGFIIAPLDYIQEIKKLQQNFCICASAFAQSAAIEALNNCDLDIKKMRQTYNQRRKFVLQRLKDMDIATSYEPTGAFYALANIKKFHSNSYKFAYEILEKAHVAVTPGIDFGSQGEGYIRLSYANSWENLAQGLDRLETFLKNYSK